ncbi:MAG: hypothetical protein ABJE95_04560 [Byssovorax sp.]
MIRRARPSLLRPVSSSRLASSFPLGVALLCGASCVASTDTTTLSGVVPTSLTVDPATFLGNVGCSNQPGALKSYVATLSDATTNHPRVELASSPPTPCSQPVSFRYVLDGHDYTVTVDGYDQPASTLVACGGPESGSRFMLPAGTTPNVDCAATLTAGVIPATPRWQTACGDVASKPIDEGNVTAACIHPFDDVAGTLPAAIVVDPRAALGALVCANKDPNAGPTNGTITFLDIKADDPNLTGYLGLPCDDSAARTYAKSLVSGATYTFHVAAHAIGETPGTPKYTAVCSAVARDGFTVPAVCGPFTAP